MPAQFNQILDVFRGNVYSGMIADLAIHLGVSAASLERLNPGWAPVVHFKHGTNYQGWWVFAERDADGKTIGLPLRNQKDKKSSYPGSKRGLTYAVNPLHRYGTSSDMGQWIRVGEAGVNCPVCNQCDGCLVNADHPDDPDGDAICVRVPAGAVRQIGIGYLHVRSTRHISALANNGGPVLIVEGQTDVAAAMDLGFDAVGRPSNLAGLDMLCELVRGRECIIVGENDKKADGREPGREGAIAALQMVQRVAKCRMVMPPEHIKDLRAWVARFELTRDIFMAHLDRHGADQAKELLLPDGRPLTVARTFLRHQYQVGMTTNRKPRYAVRRWQGSWYIYRDGKYDPVEREEFRQPIYPWSHDKMVLNTTPKGESLTPLLCNLSLVNNMEDAIISETLIASDSLPVWINGRQGPDPKNLIVFTNGILNVPAFLENVPEEQYLMEATPDLFTTVALPFAFDPTQECPHWLAFLTSSLGDDPNKIDLLQEWFGYCLTADTSLQKLMFLRGPTGAGKGVVCDVLARMMGPGQVASTSFADLSGSFGVQALLGKSVCILPDARTPSRGDSMRGLELLLNIAGGDAIQINRKYRDPLDRHHLLCRITIASNEFLDVPDHAGAMVRRLNVIDFAKSFAGQMDPTIRERVFPEVAGIAVWALAGLRRLREQSTFTLPESSARALKDWLLTNSPLAGCLEQTTDPVPDHEESKEDVYMVYCGWSKERGMVPVAKGRFLERMRANAPYAISASYEQGGHKHNVYRGIRIQPWAARQYLGRPE